MRSPKRWMAVAVTAALLLAACGGGDDDDSADGGGGGGNGDEKPELPECPLGAIDEAGGGPVEITFWHAMTNEVNEGALVRLTDQFNASQSDVRVKLVNQGSYRDTLTKFTAALGTGNPPDLVQVEDTGTQLMIDSQSVLPAQSCIDGSDYDTSDFVPRVLEYYTVEDVLYPMPFNVSNPVLYYDKNAFREAGLDPDKPPATLDEVTEASQKIVDSGVRPHGIAIKTDAWHLEQMLAKGGAVYVNNGNGRDARASATAFDNETGQEAFAWLGDMVDSGLGLSTGTADLDHYFAIANEDSGAAMTYDTSAALGRIGSVLGTGQFANVELGVGPMPGPEGDGGVLVGGAALYIVNASAPEKQEAAWRYTQYLNQPEVQADWHVSTGYIPTRKSAIEEAAVQQRWTEEPGYRVAYEQLAEGPENVATAGPVIGAYQGVRDAVVAAMTEMFQQGVDPLEALSKAAADGTAAIEEYNARIG